MVSSFRTGGVKVPVIFNDVHFTAAVLNPLTIHLIMKDINVSVSSTVPIMRSVTELSLNPS